MKRDKEWEISSCGCGIPATQKALDPCSGPSRRCAPRPIYHRAMPQRTCSSPDATTRLLSGALDVVHSYSVKLQTLQQHLRLSFRTVLHACSDVRVASSRASGRAPLCTIRTQTPCPTPSCVVLPAAADLLSALDFDETGDYLATGAPIR